MAREEYRMIGRGSVSRLRVDTEAAAAREDLLLPAF